MREVGVFRVFGHWGYLGFGSVCVRLLVEGTRS